MRRIVPVSILVAGLLGGTACIIGTWPTPESTDRTTDSSGEGATAPAGVSDEGPIGAEDCDGLDNDADGSVDEGCFCSVDVPRGCVAWSSGQCGFGLQRCVGGIWQLCGDLGPPYSAPRQISVEITSIDPSRLTRLGSEAVTVEVVPKAVCAGIQVPAVTVILESGTPVMRLEAIALDNGEAPDLAAGDGTFTASLVNPFGPGVPAQTLRVRADVTLSGVPVSDNETLPLEEP